MASKIRFGTDGWRSVIAEDYTFDNVKRISQGFASYLKDNGDAGQDVVVGYDKRFHSEHFSKTAVEVLVANGFNVFLTDKATPTPVISFAVPYLKAAAAVNITASHNPPTDNGFKVRDKFGGSIAPAELSKIEALIPDSVDDVKLMPFDDALESKKVTLFDPEDAYIEHISKLVDIEAIKNAGINVVYDAMWGNGAGWFSKILAGGTTKITEIHAERNPAFPDMLRPEPIPPNINTGLAKTVELGADVLIVNDGDADRIGIGDENGSFVNQLQVYALMAYYLLEIRQQRGPIVKTLSTTSMLNKLGKIYNVPVHETGVGFKYVAPKMIETDAMVGGEESGGYAFKNHVPERDGILAGLFILDLMVKTGKKPSELLKTLFSIVGNHYYDRIDTRFKGDRESRKDRILNANPKTIGGLKVTELDSTDGFKFSLEDGGWLLIRFSGTEPVLRVYCETTHEECVQDILKDGLKIAGIA